MSDDAIRKRLAQLQGQEGGSSPAPQAPAQQAGHAGGAPSVPPPRPASPPGAKAASPASPPAKSAPSNAAPSSAAPVKGPPIARPAPASVPPGASPGGAPASANAASAKRALAQAEQVFRAGQLDKALQLAEVVAVQDARSPEPYFLLGKIHAARNELDSAINEFVRATRIQPGNLEYQLEYAISLFNANRKDEALVAFRAAQALQPDNQTVKNYLALLARTAGHAPRPRMGAAPAAAPPGEGLEAGSAALQPSAEQFHGGGPRPRSGPGSLGGTHSSPRGPYVAQPVTAPPISAPGRTPTSSPSARARSAPGRSSPSGVERRPSGLGHSSPSGLPRSVDKSAALAEAFQSAPPPTREEEARRLRALDLASENEGELKLDDPAFWEKYRHYSSTKNVVKSAAEESGDVFVVSQDFNKLHREEYEQELEQKAAQTVYKASLAKTLSFVCWPFGALYLGNSGAAFNRLLLLGFVALLLAAGGYLGFVPVYTEDSARDWHGIKAVEDMRKANREFITERQGYITMAGFGLLALGALIFAGGQFHYPGADARESRRRNLSLGLITEMSQDIKLTTNLGTTHGITAATHLIVEKRTFHADFDNASGAQQIRSEFARIGRCEILELLDDSCVCAFHPDKGERVVLPKVGDRITVVEGQ